MNRSSGSGRRRWWDWARDCFPAGQSRPAGMGPPGTTGRLPPPVVVLLLILATACTPFPAAPTATPPPTVPPSPTPRPTLTPTPTPTPTPPPTPTPTPTPEPTPLPAVEWLRQGDALLADGDYEGALRLYQEALNRHTGTPFGDEAGLRLAQTYLEMGRPLSATQALAPLYEQMAEPLRHQADFLLGESYRAAGNCLLAIPYYRAYREGGTLLDDLIAERLAWCHRALGDHAGAAEEFARAAGPYRSLSDQASMLEEAARELRDLGESDAALARYEQILALASKEWYRATILSMMGETLQEAGRTEEAVARWQEALNGYPDTTAASWAADALLNAGAEVDAYAAGRAYRAAGRPLDAVSWLETALERGLDDPQEVRYTLAQARAEAGDLEGALADLDALLEETPDDADLLLEKGRLQGTYGSIAQALRTYHDLVEQFPERSEAGEALWRAGQLLERQRHDEEAVAEYDALVERYPEHARAEEAAFRAGLLLYRQERFNEAAGRWSGNSPRAAYWRGLALMRAGRPEEAHTAWTEAAAGQDYYADRARQALVGEDTFGRFSGLPVWEDEEKLRRQAEAWLAERWSGPFSTTLPLTVRQHPLFGRGEEWLSLGQARQARQPFSALVEAFRNDPAALYALAHHLRQERLYALSIQCASRIAKLADLEPEEMPPYLQQMLYPIPYAHIVVSQAQANGLDPLLLFALIRQESLFDRYATSWAQARGLTQVIPSTGEWIAGALGVNPFRVEDLYRPVVSIRFGAWYLAQQVQTFEGQAIPALAAYNGGPGNALRWAADQTPVADLDLFVEEIDFTETRGYIERIYSSYWYYRRLYGQD